MSFAATVRGREGEPSAMNVVMTLFMINPDFPTCPPPLALVEVLAAVLTLALHLLVHKFLDYRSLADTIQSN